MNVLIVDDEVLARTRLKKLISGIDGVEVAGEAANGVEGLEQVYRLQPDCVLLDIRMPGMNGLELGRHLSALENPPAIIFTTAYDEFALQAFKAHAVDYLLKPISQEQLDAGLSAARKTTRAQLQGIDGADGGRRSHICTTARGDLQIIDIHDIYYFKADAKYVEIRHTGGVALIEESLTALEDEFAQVFIRVHRNALVAPSRLAGLHNNQEGQWQLTFKDIDEVIDVSRRQLPKIRALLKS